MTWGALAASELASLMMGLAGNGTRATRGVDQNRDLDPLSSPYKTSSIHDVHGAHVAVDIFNKRGGVLGRPGGHPRSRPCL